ncbi:MAG: bacterioferritin [Myxococcota bacterium]
MNGDKKIIDCLNALLTHELTAVDLYVVQARMLANWGFTALQDRLAHEADDEREHANRLMHRILFLGGQPDVASRAELKVGNNPAEILAYDLQYEIEVGRALNEGIALCCRKGDNGTRALLEQLLRDTEDDHIFWLQQQLSLIEKVGLKKYLSEQL